ncbi:uncharacterized protein LOC107367840 [Tetranychus urticae]|uniref:Genetic suppressor element-like domain-containing protein n=1 Tax=Tetranychus urticae TaxID=32264 RepID=T1KWN9_TETUR|nr:uncharacterized protein LOC107367840 [Tetranychus urticae]
MKKFILEKNFQTGMTVHPLSTNPTTATSTLIQTFQPQLSSSSSPQSLSPSTLFTINGYNTNGPSKSHQQGVNSNQLIHSPANNPINSIGNHNDSGFQQYRTSVSANASSSLEESLLKSAQSHNTQSSGPSTENPGSSSSSAPANLTNHILPYSERLRSAAVAAGYTYNPFIGSPSHANPSASMPPSQSSQSSHHNLTTHMPPHPPAPYRIEDPMYLERYGIMRSGSSNIHQTSNVQSLNHSELSPGHVTSNSNVPSYQMSSRYSELLATHQERVLNDEKQRLLGHGTNSNHVSTHSHQHPSNHPSNHPPVSSSGPPSYKMNTSVLSNCELGIRNREYLTNGNLLVGMSAREMNSMSNSNKKQLNGSVTISNPGTKPLNLTSNSTVISNKDRTNAILIDIKKDQTAHMISNQFGHQLIQSSTTFTTNPVTTISTAPVNNHLWRPQINERDDSRVGNRINPDFVKRNNAFENPIDYSYTKKQRFSDLPSDFSLKSSIEISSQPFVPCNPSPFLINTPDHVSQMILSRPQQTQQTQPSQPLQSHQPHQPPQSTQSSQSTQKPSVSSPHQSNLNIQSKKSTICELTPSNRPAIPVYPTPHKDYNGYKPTEPETKVVSKLDLLEMKLKARRKERAERPTSRASVETSDDELTCSEDESDEEESELNKARNRLKYMITSGPPLKLDAKPEKIDFLSRLGLVTHSTKRNLLFNKHVSSRRFHSNLDAKPFDLTNVPQPELYDSENIFLQPTDILPSSLNKAEVKFDDKCGYMNILGLKHELNAEKMKERELLWEGVLEERDRRRSINLSYGKITNNLSKETLDKWLNYLSSQPRIYPERFNKNGVINGSANNSTSSSSSFSLPSSLENCTPLAVNNSWHNQRRTLNVTDRKQSKSNNAKQGLLKSLDNKEFAQKNSKQKAEAVERMKDDSQSIKCVNMKSESYSDPGHKDKSTKNSESNHSTGFKWPGIEAILEAYEKYTIETQLEKEFLSERISELKSAIKEKNAHVEKLTKTITSLTNVQRELDEEREEYENKINLIKRNLNQIAHSLEVFKIPNQ